MTEGLTGETNMGQTIRTLYLEGILNEDRTFLAKARSFGYNIIPFGLPAGMVLDGDGTLVTATEGTDAENNFVFGQDASFGNVEHPDTPLIQVAVCISQKSVDRFLEEGVPVLGCELKDKRLSGCMYIVDDVDAIDDDLLYKVYCRHFELPMKILETQRTEVREIAVSDIPALRKIYAKPGMTDYIEDLYQGEEEEIYQKQYIHNIYGLYDFGLWAVISRKTGDLIGRAGIEVKDGFQEGTVELSYQIDPDLWGRGLATEVCVEILRYAEQKLGKTAVIARVDPENYRSIGLLKRLGFQSVKGERLKNFMAKDADIQAFLSSGTTEGKSDRVYCKELS